MNHSVPENAGLQPGSASSPNSAAGLEPSVPRGWYSPDYLPHRDEIGLLQSITFRLADSLPQEKLRELEEELALQPEALRDVQRRKRIEHWLDGGMGCCALKHPRMAETMENALLHFDGERYRLIAWCIMPNHVHVVIEPRVLVSEIVRSWKSYTGRWALAHHADLELGIPGKILWMREYWDRFVRSEEYLRLTIYYIDHNPVKAGLCATPRSWPWSGARFIAGNAGL